MHEFTCIHAFTHSNTHLMCGAAQGNTAAAQKKYAKRFSDGNMLNRKTFQCFHATLCASGLFYKAKHDIGNESYHRILAMKETVLRRI